MYPRSFKTYDGYFKVSFPGVEFLGSTSEYRNRKKNLSSSVDVFISIVRRVGKFHAVVGSDSDEMYQKA